MTDLDELVIAAVHKMRETATQAQRLAAGLRNAAPADSSGQPNHSIQYLQSITDMLNQSASDCLQLGPAHFRESENKSQEK